MSKTPTIVGEKPSLYTKLIEQFRARPGGMKARHQTGPHCELRLSGSGQVWDVTKDGVAFGVFGSRGDAVRAAYTEARREERLGHPTDVFSGEDGLRMPHHEPHLET